MLNKPFIKTTDKETADKLRSEGLAELPKQGNFFVFVNTGKHFSNVDESKVFRTEILTI